MCFCCIKRIMGRIRRLVERELGSMKRDAGRDSDWRDTLLTRGSATGVAHEVITDRCRQLRQQMPRSHNEQVIAAAIDGVDAAARTVAIGCPTEFAHPALKEAAE